LAQLLPSPAPVLDGSYLGISCRTLGDPCQIDWAIEEAAKPGKTNIAPSAMEAQRRVRAGS